MRKLNHWFILAGTVTMFYVMGVTGRILKTAETPLGILDLEFANNSVKTGEIMSAWSNTEADTSDKISAAIKNTWLDFIFIFFYSFLLFHTCRIISKKFKGPLLKTGNALALGALLAGSLDVAENTGMLITLNGHVSATVAMLTSIFAITKWMIVITILAFIILTGPVALTRQFRNFTRKLPGTNDVR